jgi:UDPglucose 6-dehydrogenase
MSYKVGIVGRGFVGGAMHENFKECFEVAVWDTVEEKRTLNSFESFVDSSDIIFVCVPTPMKENGECDISIVEDIIAKIANLDRRKYVVIKSTVPPGTTQRLAESHGMVIGFNPEFLTEVNAVNDMRNQQRIVLGGQSPYVDIVQNIFQMAFPKVLIIKTDSTTAEMVKYVTNCMLAVKVSFANEVAQICEALDKDGYSIEYNKVIEYAKLDQRLGETHWSVPGPVPVHNGRYARGFGGHCFPKDINALISVARSYGIKFIP